MKNQNPNNSPIELSKVQLIKSTMSVVIKQVNQIKLHLGDKIEQMWSESDGQ